MAIIDLTIASGRDESMDMIDGGFDQLIFWLTPGWIVDSQIPSVGEGIAGGNETDVSSGGNDAKFVSNLRHFGIECG